MESRKVVPLPAEQSLNQVMDSAKKHYSSLFFLPSFRKALLALAVECLIAGGLSIALFPTLAGLISGLLLGVILLAVNVLADWLLSQKILHDPIFNMRRSLSFSLFSWIFWIFFVAIGVAFGLAFGYIWWVKLCLLGFAALLTFRTVVLLTLSSTGKPQRIFAVLLPPFACLVPFFVYWFNIGVSIASILPFLVAAPVIACLAGYIFISSLDRLGQKTVGTSSMSLFKAFMLNWVASLNSPLEESLEKLGKEENVQVFLLKFDSAKPKAAFIVPLVHPGPFNNVGSSLLPSMLKSEYEKEYGSQACVPLGVLGHELDAASQTQNKKIIAKVLNAARMDALIDKATPTIRVKEGFVSISCQIFGKVAFLVFTLAPKTTEDLPQELQRIVSQEAATLGLESAISVNAHNSLTESTEIEASLETLHRVASEALAKAAVQPAFPFEVGVSTVYPRDFTLKDGMGAGGITAVVTKVLDQKTAYIVIDGNNMVSGLREKIQAALEELGFQESEVLTTDTHAVSAVVLGHRGYHPVGETMDQSLLINYIKQVAQEAAFGMEICRAGFATLNIPGVKVIGKEYLESVSPLVDKTIRKAKRLLIPIFGIEGALLILLLALLF